MIVSGEELMGFLYLQCIILVLLHKTLYRMKRDFLLLGLEYKLIVTSRMFTNIFTVSTNLYVNSLTQPSSQLLT